MLNRVAGSVHDIALVVGNNSNNVDAENFYPFNLSNPDGIAGLLEALSANISKPISDSSKEEKLDVADN
ncbi:MAG: hypothetical protein DCF25_15990 [Leptolyngbya foveolarum]|uniref:Uncharacterized protein n=1 Tax=Leptolyngbya foveolarum TaxID=47253 RepID=A0A2W4VUS9_9CYAN|nr:MAG: hypothetical protein DCF25_15990 [Leptolyngbya foveolarum]